MGRQYNYYIDRALDEKFCQCLFLNGYQLLCFHPYPDIKMVRYADYISLCDYQPSGGQFFIYKEEWGALASETDETVFRDRSPVIEYNRSCINETERLVTRGRLYLNTYYKNEISDFEMVSREYNKLVRLLKKNIPYTEYKFDDGQVCLFPISQGVVDMVEEGYSLYMAGRSWKSE